MSSIEEVHLQNIPLLSRKRHCTTTSSKIVVPYSTIHAEERFDHVCSPIVIGLTKHPASDIHACMHVTATQAHGSPL